LSNPANSFYHLDQIALTSLRVFQDTQVIHHDLLSNSKTFYSNRPKSDKLLASYFSMRRLLAIFSLTSLVVSSQESAIPLPEILPPPDVFDNLLVEPIPTLPPAEDPLAGLLGGDRGTKPGIALPSSIRITANKIDPKSIGGKKTVRFSGRIKLTTDNGLQAFADDAIYNSEGEYVKLIGNVSIYQSGFIYRGESAVYYLDTKELDTNNLRLGLDPILMEAGSFKKLERNGRTIFVGENSGITTHDVENPDFWLRAKRTTIIPGEQVIFDDFTLEASDRSIFWLPYLAQPLDANLGYLLIPGARSNLGLFVKNRYGVMLGGERDPVTGENEETWLLSQWHVDLYSLRGVGLGVDFFDTRLDKKDQFGWLKLYHIHDFNATRKRAGVDRGYVAPDRYRVEFAHRIPVWESMVAKYTFDANLTWLSDAYYLEDFDPAQYRVNRVPDTYLGLVRRSANSQTTLGARVRLNNFYQSDTRLPEITHDWIRQPFMGTPVLYESQSSFGFYEEHLADFQRDSLRNQADALLPGDPRGDEIDSMLAERGFSRFHTYHEFSLPLKAGHLNIIPRIGAGHTSYQSVLGPDSSTSRTHLSAGIDFSTKLTSAYPSISSHKWGLDGVSHIVEPYASISWLATDELDSSFGRIDRLTPTTRPRSRHVGRFTAIDDLQDWGVLRLGMRNRLVTRRDGGTHDWLMLDTYCDTFLEDPEFNRSFSNLYNDLTWNPTPWFTLDLETQFPLFSDSNFTEVAASFRFMPTADLEFNIDYRHLNDHPILRDSDRLVLESFARLNEYWGIGTHHRFELVDQTLELQQYNVHYDFDSFVGSVGLFHRNNRDEDEYGIMFSFGIKEIPSLSLPIEIGAE
jgi:LPS-assembly protein